MQKLHILVGRMAIAACLTAMPLALSAQTGSMSSGKQDNMAGNATASDKKFVTEAAQGGMAEVELGKLAAEKAASPKVKEFGQRMVDDHTKAGDELKGIASNKGIQIPDKLNAKDEMTKQRLSKLSGEQFDKAYMSDMVKDHTQDVADFQKESKTGNDPDVKAFASKTLPTLKDHLKHAKELAPTTTASGNSMGGQQ